MGAGGSWELSVVVALLAATLQSCANDAVGEGLFCKDPDTTDYYPVNSTWRSTTFCGNYTCKVRTKNITVIEYTPITVNKDKKRVAATSDIPADLRKIIHKIDAINKEKINPANTLNGEICYKCNEAINPDEDRYLNKDEVNSITKFLYSVKKSDFDTLVQMYQIASELYGEMETSATEDTPEAVVPTQSSMTGYAPFPSNVQTYNPLPARPVSPWYNPSAYLNGKQDYFQDPKPVVAHPYYIGIAGYPNPAYKNHGSHFLHSASDPTPQNTHNTRPASSNIHLYSYPSYPYIKSLGMNEQLTANSPLNSMQTTSIYSSRNLPYPSPILASQYIPYKYYNLSSNPYIAQYLPLKSQPLQNNVGEYNQKAQENIAHDINCPFAMPHIGNMRSNFHLNTIKAQNGPILVKTEENILNKGSANTALKWKTAPISAKTLDSVRAHVLQKTPSLLARPSRLLQPGIPNPLTKIKLEKVGKVLRLGDLKRTRREVNETKDIQEEKKHIVEEIKHIEEEIKHIKEEKSRLEKEKHQENDSLETYVSTDRCELVTEPGYFRAGNSSLPYPLCCPQRLADP